MNLPLLTVLPRLIETGPSHRPDAASPSEAPAPRDRSATLIALAALVALVLKLAIASSTLGTNDTISFYHFGRSLSEHGLEWTYSNGHVAATPTDKGVLWFYSHAKAFNHPPLVAYYLRAIYEMDHLPVFQDNGISFPLLLRLPGILADCIVVLLLTRLRKRLQLPTWSLVALALNPVSLMVSGFHGNTDSLMVLFLVLAAWMALRRAPIWCGVLLALSCQVKIVPLLLVPVFACFWLARGKTLRFTVPFALTSIVASLQALVWFPMLLLTNVLAYGSAWGCWGITYLLRLTGHPEFSVVRHYDLPTAEVVVMTSLKVVLIVSVAIIAWRRRRLGASDLFRSLALAWIVFFAFAPGIAPQYMVWLLPFVLVLSPTLAACLLASSSVFLFVFYQTTADGFPWYLALATPETNEITTPWGLLPWVVLLAGVVIFAPRLVPINTNARLVQPQTSG